MATIANVIFLLTLLLSPSAGAAGLSWHGSTEIAAGRGERGPWRQNDSRYDYVDDPSIAIDERGQVAVVWVDQGRKDVFFRKSPDSPVNVSRSPGTFSWLPRIAAAPQDPRRIYVLWQEIIFSGGSHGGEILFARSEDGGATFSEPVNLSNSVAGDGKGRISRDLWHNGSLDIAVAADGALYAAWTEYEGALWFTRSSDGGKTFSPLLRVSGDDAAPARGPSLATAPGRTVYLGWTVGDIRVAKSADGGASFGEPRTVVKGTGYSDAPKLAVDPRGTLHLVYAGRNRILYTRSADEARTFEPARHVSGPGAAFPALSIDAQGHLYVLWELGRGLGIAVSREGGKRFSRVTVPQSADPAGAPNGSFQGLLMKKLAVNRDGEIAIVNSSLKDGDRSRVWLIRGTYFAGVNP